MQVNKLASNAEIAIPAGRYEVGNSEAANGYIEQTDYYKANILNVTEFAPIVDGWVEFEEVDTDVYNVTFSVYDDKNNNITGTYINVMAPSASSASRPTITL